MKLSALPRLPTGLFACALLSAAPLTAAPTLLNDSFDATEDTPLVIPAPGVLANDTADPPGASMSTGVAVQPAHGTVALNTDGGFTYTPAQNFSGPDSFTYNVLGARQFTIDQARSIVTINAKATISLGSSTSSDTAHVNGNALVFLSPPVAPFQQVQVQGIHANLAERADLSFSWLFGLAGLKANILANELQIDMTQAGPPVSVAADGTFSQNGNTLHAVGTANTTATGAAANFEIPPTIDIDNSLPYDMTNAQITTVGSNLELKIPLSVVQQFVATDGSYTVDMTISGNLYAVAPVNPVPVSVSATVNLNVNAVDDLPAAVADRYYTRQNLPVSVPASATETTETLIASGSVWKYSAGADRGAAWRSAEYDDNAWATGTGILGYGDPDILPAGTVLSRPFPGLPADAATNANFPTTCFRKEFLLSAPYDTVLPTLELMRDDAAIVYINGVEVYRDSAPYTAGGANPLPAAPAAVPWGTYAAVAIPDVTVPGADDEKTYKPVTFSRGVLREGYNVVAVEVHQQSATSSDLRFDLRLKRTRGVAGLLANDTDPDGPAMRAAIHKQPSNGTVTVNGDGSFSWQPVAGFTGTDSFYYRITDGSGSIFTSETRVATFGSTWKYLDNGTAAPQDANMTAADWRNIAFADTAWKTGAGEFGYGDGGETTVIEDDATPGSPTAGSTTRYITSYFRQKFTSQVNSDLVQSLKLRVIRDDGVAVWLNGHRIMKDNLPTTFTSATPAQNGISGADETTPVEELNIPASYLQSGENILAAEVHQNAPDSSDVSFALELIAVTVAGARVEVVVLDDDADNDKVSDTWERENEIDATAANGGADADGDGSTNREEFLAGTDPNDASSRFFVRNVTLEESGALSIETGAGPGRSCRLQYSTALDAWTDTGPVFQTAPEGSSTIVLTPVPAAAMRFFRIKLLNDWQ